MLKLGIVSDEISQDFEHALEIIKELGVKYVELRSMWDKNLVYLSSSELKKAKRLLRENDLKVSVIASPVFKSYLEEKDIGESSGDTSIARERSYHQHLKILEHCFKLAEIFETNIVRIFSFWKEGVLTDEILEKIVRRFETPLKMAQEENIILALENEHACYIGSGKGSKRFMDRVSSRNMGLIWDPGNAYFTGECPYPDGYKLVKDRIVHVHIKDAGKDKEGKPRWLPVGKGEIDFNGQFKALDEAIFPGIVSLETHYVSENGSKEDGTKESFKGLRSILQLSGVAF